MSVTILDIMHLPSLQEARIVAGMNGINRSIASVSVLEAAAAKDLDSTFLAMPLTMGRK